METCLSKKVVDRTVRYFFGTLDRIGIAYRLTNQERIYVKNLGRFSRNNKGNQIQRKKIASSKLVHNRRISRYMKKRRLQNKSL